MKERSDVGLAWVHWQLKTRQRLTNRSLREDPHLPLRSATALWSTADHLNHT